MDFLNWTVEHFKPKIKQKPWMKTKVMKLATIETLPKIIDDCIASKYASWDIETEGLNKNTYTHSFHEGRTQHAIVGHCLSPDGETGYYIPIRHKRGSEHNLPISFVHEQLMRLVRAKTRIIFHNNWFDATFLQYNGGEPLGLWDDPDKWEDIWILAYLENSKASDEHISLGLKALSERYLKFKQIELEELFPKDWNGPLDFSELDPSWEPCLWYAASDAICTYLLFKYFESLVLNPPQGIGYGQSVVYKIEKLCAPATRWAERVGIPIDRNKVAELIRIGQREYFESIKDVYGFCREVIGRDIEPEWMKILESTVKVDDVDFNITQQIDAAKQMAKRTSYSSDKETVKKIIDGKEREFPKVYDILSRPQLGPLFEELEIPNLKRTEKSGQVQTTQVEIDRLNTELGDKYPFLPKISRMGELRTALGTFLFSLYNDLDVNGRLHCKLKQLGTETGRFKTPSGRPEEGGTKYTLHGTPGTANKKKPECIRRIRECFAAPEGKAIVAIDFASVELRIVTNLSKEPKWLKEYFRCSSCSNEFSKDEIPPSICPKCGSDKIGDLHTLTAIAFYGTSKMGTDEWKSLRGACKAANFAKVYGGGPSAIQRATKCEDHVAAHQSRVFDQTYDVLQAWQENVIKFGRKHEFVTSAFGRHYPLPEINLPVTPNQEPDWEKIRKNKKQVSAAKRNAVNAPIQMTSADITKLSMGLLYKEIKKRGWFDKVDLLITIHDELVFLVDLDILGEFLKFAPDVMARNPAILGLKWEIPLVCDTEIGNNWTVPFNLIDWTNGLVREDGVVLDFRGNPTKTVWPMEFVNALAPVYGVRKIDEVPEKVFFTLKNLSENEMDFVVSSLKENRKDDGSFIVLLNGEGEFIYETSSKFDSIRLRWIFNEAGLFV